MAKRLIDADELKRRMMAFTTGVSTNYLVIENIVMMINQADTVDAVEVVSCKDCKISGSYERMDGRTGYCCLHILHSFTYGQTWDRVFNPVKEPDDFCSYGERKGDDV